MKILLHFYSFNGTKYTSEVTHVDIETLQLVLSTLKYGYEFEYIHH